MSTSANVIEYDIRHRITGESVAHHRQNIMCKPFDKSHLTKLEPASDYLVYPYGYDEEEELWEDEPIELTDFLKQK